MIKRSFKLLALLMVVSTIRADLVIMNQNQYDDWQGDAKHVIRDAARKAGIKPGQRFSMSLQVCIDNEVANIIFFVTGGQGSTVYVDKVENAPSGDECNPSTDLSGGDLSSPNSIKAIQNTVSGILGPKDIPSRAARQILPRATASTFALVPPYRDVPFIPVFQPPLDLPTSLDCNPSNGATTIQVHHSNNTVSINRGCSGALLATIPVATAPLQADVTPDGTLAIVTSFNNAVNFINLTTNSVAYTLQTTPDVNPSGVVISTDGSTAYVTSFTSALFQGTPELLIINIAQRKIVGTLPVSDFPQSVFITPDGSQVWVTHPFSSTIEIIDTLTNTQSYGLLVQSSFDIVFDSTGTRAFIAGGASNVVVIDTASYATLATIPVGQSPEELVLTPEDGMLIVSNYAGRSVTLVDASGYTVLGTFSLPGKMRGLALIQ